MYKPASEDLDPSDMNFIKFVVGFLGVKAT